MLKNQKGFTLIELLIVIVIIGILAGVLIAIIDPVRQQNRARDAGVQATINKVVLATEGFVSAYGRTPFDDEFLDSLSNASDSGATCEATNDKLCFFTIVGNELPETCVGGGAPEQAWAGADTSQCYYRYIGEGLADVGNFQIYAKSFGINNTVFRYDNRVGAMEECDVNGANCVPLQ